MIVIIISVSCKQKTAPVVTEALPEFNNQLTVAEKAGGVMTPEIMWKFGRLGTFALSPDGSSVLFAVTHIDLQSEARETNIFKISSDGGDPVQLTAKGGSSPQWFDSGKKIAFVKGGDLMTMNSDGSDQKKVTGISEFEIYNISPVGNKIYFTKRVKLDQTANEKHNLPKAMLELLMT
jgi:Tol biopolymer transport system component